MSAMNDARLKQVLSRNCLSRSLICRSGGDDDALPDLTAGDEAVAVRGLTCCTRLTGE